jgi:hypothetical protein
LCTIDDARKSQRNAQDYVAVMRLSISFLDGCSTLSAISSPAGPAKAKFFHHIYYDCPKFERISYFF